MRDAWLCTWALALAACGVRSPAVAPPQVVVPRPVAEASPPERAPACPQRSITPADPSGVLVTLRRTACYGSCPTYEVSVARDGAVRYLGTRYVKQCEATGRLDEHQLAELGALMDRTGYLQLQDAYTRREITDAASVFTSYAPAGREPKLVAHYLGDSSAPPALREVEAGIDRILDIERWIGTADERALIYLSSQRSERSD